VHDAEAEACSGGDLVDLQLLEPKELGVGVFEQSQTAAENDRHDGDMQLVDQPGAK
jgi:hypothetical protein